MEGGVGLATGAESRCFMETQKVRKRSEDACGACWSLVSSFTSFTVSPSFRWSTMLLEAWTRSAFELAPLSLASKASFRGLSPT